jgi:DNA-binding NarL/FixJ family response regulator
MLQLNLTRLEFIAAMLIVHGYSNVSIEKMLLTSKRAVESYVQSLLDKFDECYMQSIASTLSEEEITDFFQKTQQNPESIYKFVDAGDNRRCLITYLYHTNQIDITLVHRGKHMSVAKKLTVKEDEILSFLVQGYSSLVIAEKLYLSRKTVDCHIYSLYRKLGILGNNTNRRCRLAYLYHSGRLKYRTKASTLRQPGTE